MINEKEDEAMEENFKSILSRYKIGLKTLMQGFNLIFDCVSLFY